jgi:hypothetical protein
VRQAAIETRVDAVAGQLEDSLFASVERLGESPMLTAKFVALFEWDFDFAADSLPGDEFRSWWRSVLPRTDSSAMAPSWQRSIGAPTAHPCRSSDSPTATGHPVTMTSRVGRHARCSSERRSSSPESRPATHTPGSIPSSAACGRISPSTTAPQRGHGARGGGRVGDDRGRAGGYGLSVTIRHARGFESMYNHLSRIVVRRGQRVHQRTVIGHVGATGLATGPHLDYRTTQERPAGESVERDVPPRRHGVA